MDKEESRLEELDFFGSFKMKNVKQVVKMEKGSVGDKYISYTCMYHVHSTYDSLTLMDRC